MGRRGERARDGDSGYLPARNNERGRDRRKAYAGRTGTGHQDRRASPRGYPPGAYDALKGKRNLAQPPPPIERLSRNGALEFGQRRFTAPRVEVPQTSTEQSDTMPWIGARDEQDRAEASCGILLLS